VCGERGGGGGGRALKKDWDRHTLSPPLNNWYTQRPAKSRSSTIEYHCDSCCFKQILQLEKKKLQYVFINCEIQQSIQSKAQIAGVQVQGQQELGQEMEMEIGILRHTNTK